MNKHRYLTLTFAFGLAACTSTTIDQYNKAPMQFTDQESIVILGRRHNGTDETEPAIISCIGNKIQSRQPGLHVIDEFEFLNQFYPWFEPRTAPLNPERLQLLLERPKVAAEFAALKLHYIIWVEGSTERDGSTGSLSCAIGPGGAGCFGFSTWDDNAAYEVAIWDVIEFDPVAWLSASASGTSYMPAVIAPIPLVARVKTRVCEGVAEQIIAMFEGNNARK